MRNNDCLKERQISNIFKTDVKGSADKLWFGTDRKWWTLAVIGSGTFMSAIDTSIVNIALPAIGKSTHASVSTIEWVILIYLITTSAFLLVVGRLADIYDKRKIYIAGQVVFTLGSLFCGLSGRIELLIVSRAVQAVGAAVLLALSSAIIISAFQVSEKGRALGIQATMSYFGMSIGPAIGGFLTQRFGWTAIFFVNVPIGLIMTCMASCLLKQEKSYSTQRFDPAGVVTMAIMLSSLLFSLSKGLDLGWMSPLILGMLGISAVSAVMFVVIERRVEHPALNFKLFTNKVFTASTLAAFCGYLCSAAINFLMPFYLVRAGGHTEAKAGLILITTPISMMLLTGPSGYISDKVGSRLPCTLGTIAMAAGILLLCGLRPDSLPQQIVPYMALVGIGAGLFNAPNNSAILGSAPKEMRGVAGAILAAARTIGFAAGVALAGLTYMMRLDALHNFSQPVAVTYAVHSGMTVIAFFAFAGVLLSAFRAKHVSDS